MRLKAIDTLNVSAVGPDNIAPGAEFDASDDQGRELVERGLAVEVKAAPAPENKMEMATVNKASFGNRKAK